MSGPNEELKQEIFLADIEAQGGDHLRLRLRTLDTTMTAWEEGTEVDCLLPTEAGSDQEADCLQGKILRQRGSLLWIHIPYALPQTVTVEGLTRPETDAILIRRTERRTEDRHSTSCAVECSWSGGKLVGEAADVSVGGLRVRLTEEITRGTRLNMTLNLSKEAKPINAQGLVVYVQQDLLHPNRFEAGIKFIGWTPYDAARLSSLLRRAS